jgi:hypothetical protein
MSFLLLLRLLLLLLLLQDLPQVGAHCEEQVYEEPAWQLSGAPQNNQMRRGCRTECNLASSQCCRC